jgi:hypothetical protein
MTQGNELQATHSDVESALAAFGGVDTLIQQVEASDVETQRELDAAQAGSVDYMGFTSSRDYEKDRLSPWNYGQDEIDVHPDSTWIVDPTTLQHGWFGFAKGPGGKLVKGQQPDALWADWTSKFPAKPTEEYPHANNRAWKFRAICASSPIEDQVGAYVEVTEYRRMAKGFAELEKALRSRVAQIKAAIQSGNMTQANELKTKFYPLVKFGYKLDVETNNGKHNQGILELVDWAIPLVVERPIVEAASDEGDLESELEEQPAPTTKRRRRRED